MRAGANILNRGYQQPVAAFTLDYDVEISDIMHMTHFGLKEKKKEEARLHVYYRLDYRLGEARQG
jgi:hypothetical protein